MQHVLFEYFVKTSSGGRFEIYENSEQLSCSSDHSLSILRTLLLSCGYRVTKGSYLERICEKIEHPRGVNIGEIYKRRQSVLPPIRESIIEQVAVQKRGSKVFTNYVCNIVSMHIFTVSFSCIDIVIVNII